MKPSLPTSVGRGVLAEPETPVDKGETKGRSNLVQRVLSALVFVPGVLLLVEGGRWPLLGLVLVVAVRSAWEWCYLSRAAGYKPDLLLALPLTAGWVLVLSFAEAAPLFLYVMGSALLFFVAALRRGTERYTANALLGLGAVLYAGLLGSAPLLLVRSVGSGPEAYHLVAVLFISIWLTDAAAYFFGRQWGRKKLAPSISPGKTVVGFCGGLLGSLLPLLLYSLLPSFALVELAGMFLLVGFGGQLGDLVESAFKRDMGNVKDAPTLIPGHGGLLDRFDSYFFAFPLAYIYAEFLGVLRSL
jgi:phosphatidate cytidylyltransferase